MSPQGYGPKPTEPADACISLQGGRSPGTSASVRRLPVKPLSTVAATVTLTQNILGAGVLALPFAVSQAGLVGALVLLALIFVLSIFSMGALVILSNKLRDFSYKGAAQQTLGGSSAVVIEVWVLCYSLGIAISYVVLLGDFLHDLASHFELGSWATPRVGMVLAVCCVCWPLSCARSLGVLKYTSALGVSGIFFLGVAVVKRYTDGSYDNPETNHPVAFNLSTFGQCFPILVGAFGAHYNIPNLYHEVAPDAGLEDEDANQRGFGRMMKVILCSLCISSVLYGTVGVVVYLMFGSATKSDFSLNFRDNDGWLVAVRMAMTLCLCVTFPLAMIPARSSVLKLANWELSARTQVPLSTALSGFCLAVAVAAGDIGVVLSYNGSIFGTPVCYVLPTVMYLFMPRSEQTLGWRTFSMACSTIGIIFGILGVIVVSLNLNKDN